ncbi:nucleotide exchange factor GrpE [Bacillus tianshenii]|uniref:nucleotide exchange factor GrpE n=1 Tax=Sutcliffiella tianshenii TaxID=1463404 RepID=UPI001CD718AD|nr:nucleotide exchange factor GrpE [Bacillus tianshenii]MCA1321572.1 nucleotide exchange factor GrpE [Bacillus tianshenii]
MDQQKIDGFEIAYKLYSGKVQQWNLTLQALSESAEALSANFQEKYEEISIDSSLPAGLVEALENRLEGIRLSVKTASRLQRKLNFQAVEMEKYEGFTLMEEAISSAEEGEASSEQVELPAVSDVAHERNQEIIEMLMKDLEALEKKFSTFIEKSIGPVMDGLYNGKKYGVDLEAEMASAYPQHAEYVTGWLRIYETLLQELNGLLEEYSVGLLAPVQGEMFNEVDQEPIAVVEDPSMQTEQIKELVRYGFYYKGTLFNQERFIIRPAQVTVVKNRTALEELAVTVEQQEEEVADLSDVEEITESVKEGDKDEV